MYINFIFQVKLSALVQYASLELPLLKRLPLVGWHWPLALNEEIALGVLALDPALNEENALGVVALAPSPE